MAAGEMDESVFHPNCASSGRGPTRRLVVAGIALSALAFPVRAQARPQGPISLEIHEGWVLRAGDRTRLASS